MNGIVEAGGYCHISSADLRDEVFNQGQYNQKLCHLLKQKGAPILGVIQFIPDMNNYEWDAEFKPHEGLIKFTWRKLC